MKLPLPEPLRAAEIPSFTHYSVVTRLPDIARRALAENPFPPETAARIEALIDEIPGGPIRPVAISGAAIGDWPAWIAPHAGKDWLEIPWFFAEEYFYLRILEATGYFAPGPWQRRDPYAGQKRLGLVSERARLRALAGDVAAALRLPAGEWPTALERLLLVDLWGNQSDLSLWPVQVEEAVPAPAGGPAHAEGRLETEIAADLERVLANDLDPLIEYLAGRDRAATRIDLLLDNAGYELAADLALADYLLASGRAAQVVLHAKIYPVFVSDALERDVHAAIDYLLHEGDHAARDEAIRLRQRLVDGRLRLTSHPFWTSPLEMWKIPAGLRADLGESALLISKGDANYRRLLGDRHWPPETPFAAVVQALPCAVLALRTLKSEIAVGLPPGRAPSGDPDWMINGRWGLIQFAPPPEERP